MHLDTIAELVNPYFSYLKRKEGKKYQGKIHNSVQGALHNNGLFFKDCKDFWRMNEEKCQEYE